MGGDTAFSAASSSVPSAIDALFATDYLSPCREASRVLFGASGYRNLRLLCIHTGWAGAGATKRECIISKSSDNSKSHKSKCVWYFDMNLKISRSE